MPRYFRRSQVSRTPYSLWLIGGALVLNALLNVRMMQTNSLVHPTEAEEMRTAIHVKAGERERGGGGGGVKLRWT